MPVSNGVCRKLKSDRKNKERIKQKRRKIIRNHPGGGSKRAAFGIIFKVVFIDRHGFRPTEPHEHKTNKPQRIEMPCGIERHSSRPLCRGIAAFIRNERMCKFMKSKHDCNGEKFRQHFHKPIHSVRLHSRLFTGDKIILPKKNKKCKNRKGNFKEKNAKFVKKTKITFFIFGIACKSDKKPSSRYAASLRKTYFFPNRQPRRIALNLSAKPARSVDSAATIATRSISTLSLYTINSPTLSPSRTGASTYSGNSAESVTFSFSPRLPKIYALLSGFTKISSFLPPLTPAFCSSGLFPSATVFKA